ncbi:phosphatidylglycerophosphatase A family protein [Halomonas koreensis]|uniref:Phosphatidylglycerophosphatase A n=1 Tax=Halomonas koreensis TaxID=245385 RepID=A0ABU1G4M0_9GAMM|nr:phosphatidylglycerophosphatase A [Halomonas koreensis]MDR5867417.1 phosphatidylglycerophosphatase A [Halomonas koreensis]
MWPATGFGLGLSPLASGTVGSLLGVPLAWWLLGRSRRWQLGLVAILLVAAMPLCQLASDTLGGKDDGRIVADEIVALPLTVLGQAAARQPLAMAGAFVAYRVLDATKPPPVAQVEAVAGGVGIVLDDAVAALYAWALVAGGLALWRRRRGA